MSMEGNSLNKAPGKEGLHIPGLSQADTYEQKVVELRRLEEMIAKDEKIGEEIKVNPEKGITPQLATKIMQDTIQRLAKNKKRYNELMGISTQ